MRIQRTMLAATLALSLSSSLAARADEYSASPQLAQDGINQALQAAANYGKGVTIGIVDTGIDATHNEFAGRISSQSTCVAMGNCANGYADTYFHGTFVASIAAGAQNGVGMVGVAPQANILAVKIAQSNGSAYSTDEVTGILTAAQRGAQVINLSFGSFYSPTQTPYYAYYNTSLVNAINTIAAQGVTIVIAGGNSATTFMANANQYGFTAAALSHMIIVGSVNNQNKLSYFSNTPGSTNFVTTSNQATALKSLWLVAPGEGLLGAYYTSNNSYAYSSGTSFSAPQVAGALALLEARWPVLYRNGTAAQVLLSTATDLGTAGTDATYGAGLMNVNNAFLPVGALTMSNAKGQTVNVTSINGSMLSSGAFGSLSAISKSLSSMTAFDNYKRDFPINLSGLVASKPTAATISLPHGVQTVGVAYHMTDGSSLAYGETDNIAPSSPQAYGLPDAQKNWYMSITDQQGSTLASGVGFPASASFAETLWGTDTAAASNTSALGISNGLLDLAEGGPFAAYGTRVGDNTRIAFSWTQTGNTYSPTAVSWATPQASAFGAGLTTSVMDGWTAGFTFNTLNEANGMLGSSYAYSPVGFGNHHNSMSFGVSSDFDLGGKRDLMLDMAMVRSDGADIDGGIITHVSDVYARSMGATLLQRDAINLGDRLSFTVKKPMQVFSGNATLGLTSVDADGNPVITNQNVSLRPDGSETDLGVSYSTPWKSGINIGATLQARHDADNIRGNDAVDMLVTAKWSF